MCILFGGGLEFVQTIFNRSDDQKLYKLSDSSPSTLNPLIYQRWPTHNIRLSYNYITKQILISSSLA